MPCIVLSRWIRVGTLVIVALTPIVGAATEGGAKPTLPPDYAATVARLQKDWSIPGAAVAVVDASGIKTIATYGLRQWNRPQTVDAETLFGIASITKTFVAAGIGLLVQEGKLSWDDRVIEHLPEFRVKDPWVTTQLTVRDLLAHRSGIESYGDFLEEAPHVGEKAVLGHLANLGQSMPFRERAEYNNYAYVVLALIIEKLSGEPWGEFLRTRLWQPLGMQDARAHADDFVPRENVLPSGDGWSDVIPTGLDAVSPQTNVAAPHVRPEAYYRGAFVYNRHEMENQTAHFHRTAIDPSQSVFASIRDMARWAHVLLAADETSQKAVLDARIIRAMRGLTSVRKRDWPINWKRQTLADTDSDLVDVGFGMGFEIFTYRGQTLFGHSGGELGYESLMVIDPHTNLAVVALVNNAWRTGGAVRSLVQTVLDWHYGHPPTDWSRHYLESSRSFHTQAVALLEQLERTRPRGTKTSMKLRDYAGEYSSPLFGTLRLEERAGKLIATTGPSWEIELDHWAHDTFRGTVVSPLRLGVIATFAPDALGRGCAVELEFLELLGTKFRFERAGQALAAPH